MVPRRAFLKNSAALSLAAVAGSRLLADEAPKADSETLVTSLFKTLTDEQKKELAEVDSKYQAKIAEKELFLKDQIRRAQTEGKVDDIDSLQKQLASEVRRLQQECEAAKEKLRNSFAKL